MHNTSPKVQKNHSIVSAELESLKSDFQLQNDQLSQSLVQQEQLMRRKVLKARQEAEQENVVLLRLYEERECQLLKKLQTSYEELLGLKQDAGLREQELFSQTTQVRQELEILLRSMLQREQEFTEQLLKTQQTAEAEKLELKQIHEERERELDQQVSLARQEIESLLRTLLQREQTANAEKADLEQYHRERERTLDETIAGLHKQISIFEAQFQQQNIHIQTEQQTCLQLRQILAEARHDLNLTHSSLTWRITAPLRRLAIFFNPSKQLGLSPPVVERPSSAVTESGAFSASNSISHQSSKEFDMTVSHQSETKDSATVANTLGELLQLQDRDFISCAYQTLLGRAPDHEGLTYYLGRIRSGISKISILGQLRLSNEGKRCAVNLPGLDDAIRRNRWIQNPFWGWIFKLFTDFEGNSAIERKLRGIENSIFLLGEENKHRFNELEASLAGVHHLLVNQPLTAAMATNGSDNDNPPSNDLPLPIQPPDLEDPKQLSAHARDIYKLLKTPDTIKGGGSV